MDTSTKYNIYIKNSGDIAEEGAERLGEPEGQDICLEVLSSIFDKEAELEIPQQHCCLNKI